MKPTRDLILLCILLFAFSGSATGQSGTAVYITKKDFPVAASEADLDLFQYGMTQNHLALWMKLRQEGRGKLSETGREVVIIEEKAPNKVKVRTTDSSQEFWTIKEALELK